MHTNAAVLIMDDDIMASAQDIQFAFRVWKVLACNSNTHCIAPYILLFYLSIAISKSDCWMVSTQTRQIIERNLYVWLL